MSFGDEQPQFPLNSVGSKGQHAFYGVHNLNMIGSGLPSQRLVGPTGVATGVQSGGIGGVAATLLTAGVYRVTHPAAVSVDIDPTVRVPTGQAAMSAFVRTPNGSPSGVAFVEVRNGTGVIANPPTGSTVSMRFFVAPITAF